MWENSGRIDCVRLLPDSCFAVLLQILLQISLWAVLIVDMLEATCGGVVDLN